MFKQGAFTILVLITFASSSPVQERRESWPRQQIEATIESTMRQHRIPGLVVGVIQDGKIVYAKGFGVAKVGSNKPVGTRSVFHMASVAKPFVATALMQLVGQGKVDLDGRVITYLPYFRLKDERYRDITIRQMLSHVSGMPDVTDYEWDRPQYDDGALERYIRGLSSSSLLSAPGEKFAYSNVAFEVLGDVIAKVSGRSFEDYVQRSIFAPLGMRQSTLLLREVAREHLTTPHVFDKEGQPVVSGVFPYNRVHAPSSTLYSTVDDMNRWALASLNRGVLERARVLKESSYELLWGPQVEVPRGDGSPYRVRVGLSWFLVEYKGHTLVGHGGSDRGFQSFLVLAPRDRASVVMMVNCSSDKFNIDSIALSMIVAILENR